MKIKASDLVKAALNGKIENLKYLQNIIECVIDDYEDYAYVRVEILNYDGNVTKDIKKAFPKFKVRWSREHEGTIGTNYVYVPREMWNDEVKEALGKFDSFVGHHVDKVTLYEVREDVELPFSLRDCVGKRYHHSDWDVKNNPKCFKQVDVIRKEWDDELRFCDYKPSLERYDNLVEVEI